MHVCLIFLNLSFYHIVLYIKKHVHETDYSSTQPSEKIDGQAV